jgi:hypothetical protein
MIDESLNFLDRRRHEMFRLDVFSTQRSNQKSHQGVRQVLKTNTASSSFVKFLKPRRNLCMRVFKAAQKHTQVWFSFLSVKKAVPS